MATISIPADGRDNIQQRRIRCHRQAGPAAGGDVPPVVFFGALRTRGMRDFLMATTDGLQGMEQTLNEPMSDYNNASMMLPSESHNLRLRLSLEKFFL